MTPEEFEALSQEAQDAYNKGVEDVLDMCIKLHLACGYLVMAHYSESEDKFAECALDVANILDEDKRLSGLNPFATICWPETIREWVKVGERYGRKEEQTQD